MKSRKVLSFFILSFIFIFSTTVFSQEKYMTTTDGTSWLRYPDPFKGGYVMGFISSSITSKKELLDWGPLFVRHDDMAKEYFFKIFNHISFETITLLQFVDGINAFYNDFSNRRIKIIDAIYVVKMQIKGVNHELISAQIQYLKMQPIDDEVVRKCKRESSAFLEKRKRLPTYKEIKNGDYSYENLLKEGAFVDANNEIFSLFCYGNYK